MGRTLFFVLLLLLLEALLSGLRPLFGITILPYVSLLGMLAISLQRPLASGYGAAILLGLSADIAQGLPLGTLTFIYIVSLLWIEKRRDVMLVLPLGGRWLKLCGWLIFVQVCVYIWVGLLTKVWLRPSLMGYQVITNAVLALPLLSMVRGRFA
jgi:cell shape-determining protein MreD